MVDVTEFPILEDFPWNWKIPRFVEVRYNETEHVLVLWAPEYRIHVDVLLKPSVDDPACEIYHPEFYERYLKPMLDNLGGAIFEEVYPGEFIEMSRRQVAAVIDDGEKWPEADRAKWLLRKALTF